MTEGEFAEYRVRAMREYAEAKRDKEGLTQDEADELARKSFEGHLGQGVRTPDHWLFAIVESDGSVVGDLWFAAQKRQLWVYDIRVAEGVRGKGYGRQTMALIESKARELGFKRIGLHVFGDNTRARKLYESCGYQEINVIMRRDL